MFPDAEALNVTRLGDCQIQNPLTGRREHFVNDEARVLLCSTVNALEPYLKPDTLPPSFEVAGPRRKVFFALQNLRCGVVTCGGLCPGLNDVVRSLVLTLN